VGGWENGRRETAESWDEGKTGEQGRGKIPASECGSSWRERRGKKKSGEEKWGEEEEREWGVRASWGPRVTPPFLTWHIATSQYGDVWQLATLANADVALCHVTK
jgi:hypothetical protein